MIVAAGAIAGAVAAVDAVAVIATMILVMCAVGYVLDVHRGQFIPAPHASDSQNMMGWVGVTAGWAVSLIMLTARTLVMPIGAVISWVMSPVLSLFNDVRYSWLPWVLHQAGATASALVGGVYAALQTAEAGLQASISALISAVVARFGAEIGALAGWTGAEVTALWRGIDTLEHDTAAALQGIEAGVRQEVGALEHALEISLQNVEAGVQAEIGALEHGVEAQIGALGRGLAGDINGVEDWVRGLLGASILPALASLGLGLRALEQSVAQDKAECVDPLCKNLGGLSNILGLLGQLGVDALMIALLAELLHDPQAVARDIEEVVAPIVRGASAAVLQQAA